MKVANLVVAALALIPTGALAQDFGIDELRAGAMIHGVELGGGPLFSSIHLDRFEDVNFEVLFRSPQIDAFEWLGSPRPAIGGTFSTKGLENMVHANLNWHVPLGDTPFFVEGGFGLAAVSGYDHNAPSGYRNLGCNVMAYFQGNVGMDLGQNWDVMATFEHSSHGWTCGTDNDGLNGLGIRVGYKF